MSYEKFSDLDSPPPEFNLPPPPFPPALLGLDPSGEIPKEEFDRACAQEMLKYQTCDNIDTAFGSAGYPSSSSSSSSGHDEVFHGVVLDGGGGGGSHFLNIHSLTALLLCVAITIVSVGIFVVWRRCLNATTRLRYLHDPTSSSGLFSCSSDHPSSSGHPHMRSSEEWRWSSGLFPSSTANASSSTISGLLRPSPTATTNLLDDQNVYHQQSKTSFYRVGSSKDAVPASTSFYLLDFQTTKSKSDSSPPSSSEPLAFNQQTFGGGGGGRPLIPMTTSFDQDEPSSTLSTYAQMKDKPEDNAPRIYEEIRSQDQSFDDDDFGRLTRGSVTLSQQNSRLKTNKNSGVTGTSKYNQRNWKGGNSAKTNTNSTLVPFLYSSSSGSSSSTGTTTAPTSSSNRPISTRSRPQQPRPPRQQQQLVHTPSQVNPDDILPETAWTDVRGSCENWSEVLTLSRKRRRKRETESQTNRRIKGHHEVKTIDVAALREEGQYVSYEDLGGCTDDEEEVDETERLMNNDEGCYVIPHQDGQSQEIQYQFNNNFQQHQRLAASQQMATREDLAHPMTDIQF